MRGWTSESTDGVWIFRHPDGRRIEASPNDKVTTPTVARFRIVITLNEMDQQTENYRGMAR